MKFFRDTWRVDPAAPDNRNAIVYLILLSAGFYCYAAIAFAQIMYNPIGYLDPYMYVDYAFRYGYADHLDAYYKVSRLPWNFTEFVFRQLFWPGPASFLIQVFCTSIMSTSVYVGIRVLFGEKPALFVAVVSVFLPFFHANAGADYHNTLAGPLYFLTFALLMISLQRASNWWALACGAGAAATVHTDPLFVLAIPAVLAPALVYARSRGMTWSALLRMAAVSIAGVAATTIVLGLINYAVGRQFLFFMPQLGMVKSEGHNNPWWAPTTWNDLLESRQNGFLAAVFAISCFDLLRVALKSGIREAGNCAAAQLGFCITYLVAVLLQNSRETMLFPEYLGYQFVAVALLPLAAVAARFSPARPARFDSTIYLFVMPILCALSLAHCEEIQIFIGRRTIPPIVIVIVLVLGFYAISSAPNRLKVFAIPVLIWPLVNSALADSGDYGYDRCDTTPHLNRLMSTIAVMSDQLTGNPNGTFTWFDRDDRFSPSNKCYQDVSFQYFAVSSSEVIGGALGGIFPVIAFDKLTKEQMRRAAGPASTVIVLYVDDTVSTRFKQVAAGLGFSANVRMHYLDRKSGIKFDFVSLTPAAGSKE